MWYIIIFMNLSKMLFNKKYQNILKSKINIIPLYYK
jgi:hypothetical protein